MKNADAYANEEMKRAAHIVKEQKKTDGQFDIYCQILKAVAITSCNGFLWQKRCNAMRYIFYIVVFIVCHNDF